MSQQGFHLECRWPHLCLQQYPCILQIHQLHTRNHQKFYQVQYRNQNVSQRELPPISKSHNRDTSMFVRRIRPRNRYWLLESMILNGISAISKAEDRMLLAVSLVFLRNDQWPQPERMSTGD